MSKNKNSFIEQLNSKYIFSIRNDDKHIESAKATLSVYELVIIFFFATLLSIIASFLLFKYTNLRHFLSTETEQQKLELLQITNKADSLEKVINQNKVYFDNINRAISGKGFADGTAVIDSQNLRAIIISDPSAEEMELRKQVQKREKFSLLESEVGNVNFSNPIDGIITNDIAIDDQHYGIDLVAPKNTPVKAAADGIIIYKSWSYKDGHILIISHDNDYITIYKHNEKILKNVGEQVNEGDAIALIGNSGENTSGYHLHFEIWQNGVPKDPSNYLSFR